MLQQILRDMWVDPEILAELDDDQKQTLFCKMREEQVRRWQAWDQKVSSQDADHHQPRFSNGKKHVQFLKGEDGEPWVWVMGEHANDKSIEAILADEARTRALAQARHEAHQLRRSVEKELTHLIDYKPLQIDSLEQKFDLSPKSCDSIDDLELYCTVDELRARMARVPLDGDGDGGGDGVSLDGGLPPGGIHGDISNNTLHFNFIEGKRDVLQDLGISNGGGDGVSHRVAAWERRVAAARAGDILRGLRARRARTLRDAQLAASHGDKAWREQERKAKEAEAAMREIARRAREAHRLSVDVTSSVVPPPTEAGKPPSREAVVQWFRSQELPRGVGRAQDGPVQWFHGLITRSEAEQILSSQPAGSFLVRVSERVWGYAISWRDAERVKHFLVETAEGYRLLPAGQITHQSLADLIEYHKSSAITECGGELLQTPCPPAEPVTIL